MRRRARRIIQVLILTSLLIAIIIVVLRNAKTKITETNAITDIDFVKKAFDSNVLSIIFSDPFYDLDSIDIYLFDTINIPESNSTIKIFNIRRSKFYATDCYILFFKNGNHIQLFPIIDFHFLRDTNSLCLGYSMTNSDEFQSIKYLNMQLSYLINRSDLFLTQMNGNPNIAIREDNLDHFFDMLIWKVRMYNPITIKEYLDRYESTLNSEEYNSIMGIEKKPAIYRKFYDAAGALLVVNIRMEKNIPITELELYNYDFLHIFD